MVSCQLLERPGWWRIAVLAAVLAVVGLPSLPLLSRAIVGESTGFGGASFAVALRHSAGAALLVVVASFAAGLPAGVMAALYDFPMRRALLALAILPLLVPVLLLAIGWSYLSAGLGLHVGGLFGCVLVFSTAVTPLVLLASYAATGALSASQIDSVRLGGGERAVRGAALRHAAVPAAVAAAFGGVLTLSDPGPGQIFGWRTAASELLASFAALYDFAVAARQCAALSLHALVCSVPLVWFAAPRLASALLARQHRRAPPLRHGWMGWSSGALLGVVALAGVVAPLAGLALPLAGGGSIPDDRHLTLVAMWAGSAIVRTLADTVLYGLGAGVVGVAHALLLAVAVGRDDRLRGVAVGVAMALLALPPATSALGVLQIGGGAPAWADPVVRSRVTVCLALGFRLVPVAALLTLRAWAATSPSWTWAAAVHGVPLRSFLGRVALPLLTPALLVSVLVVALLATADVTTVLLLHPPGGPSLPLEIFTVMSNAPERLVAALCLLYVALSGAGLIGLWAVAGRR